MNESVNSTASAVAPATREWELLRTIYTYKGEWNTYLARSLDDDHTPRIYEEALKRLENWTQPATNFCEALAALELAEEFYEAGTSDVIPCMIKAAKDWMQDDRQGRAMA
ncbi:hypothetical protein ACQKKX_02260 [Neorhizobium sp. NPDC001467]|uniref:hypothetical protein n=1 Tax=Neorhizobium sp. NPDC001467 TaxID=3390595 RepID=UPI003D02FABA